MSAEGLTILLSGRLAGVQHQGGATWAILQYVLGLRRLGHEVWFVEPVPGDTLAAAAPYFAEVTRAFDLEDRAAIYVPGTERGHGVPRPRIDQAADRADMLLNVSGLLTEERWLDSVRSRVYVDVDPAFTQLWHVVEGIDMGFDSHDRFVTVGLAIGDPECEVPTAGRDWITTVPPVVLEAWPPGEEVAHDALTTVGNWRGYGSIEWRGSLYGQRAHSLRELIDLPGRTRHALRPALDIDPGERQDLEALRSHGWTLLEASDVAETPDRYRAFIRGSKGELGIAKSGYVLSRCGWFSDRSACYLAAGRPVLAQDTGFPRYLPTGDGLMAFDSAETAAERIEDFHARYADHRKAARALAEEVFDSDRVLAALLERLGTDAG